MNEVARPIEVITQEINFYKVQAGVAIIEIGKRLCEAKQCLPHGAWGEWLQNEVEFSERTAQNFMKIAREIQNPQLVADMGNSTTKALLLLSVPAEDRQDFVAESHIIDGEAKTVAEMTIKEMEDLTKQLAEERAEKEKLQAQLDLFQDEAQKEKDEAVDKVMFEAEQEMDRVKTRLTEQKDIAEGLHKEALDKIRNLERELDEMKMAQDQVSIPDETELERVRAEAEAKTRVEMEAKLEKEKANAKKYRKKAAEATKAIEAHELAQKEAEEAALQAKEELAKAKAAQMPSTSTTEVFKVRFETVLGEVNKMMDCIQQAEEAGRADEANDLRMKLKKLSEMIMSKL